MSGSRRRIWGEIWFSSCLQVGERETASRGNLHLSILCALYPVCICPISVGALPLSQMGRTDAAEAKTDQRRRTTFEQTQTYSLTRKFNFVATAQPPATTKEVQYRPLNRLVDKIRNCLSDKRRSFFAHPHIKQPVISLLPCSMRLHDCYIIKLTCQRLCPGLLLSQWAVVAGVNREEGSQAASRGLAAWLI